MAEQTTTMDASQIVSGTVAAARGGAGTSNGLLKGDGAGAVSAVTYASGTYTPTLSNTTNVAASTPYVCQYLRVGNIVFVSGKVDVDATTSATATVLGISLPIASNFANAEECAGTGSANITFSVSTSAPQISADPTNDRAIMSWLVATAANHTIFFHFMYQVI